MRSRFWVLALLAASPAVAQPPPPPPPVHAGGLVVDRTVGTILPNMLPSRIGATIDVRFDYSNDVFDSDASDVTLIGFNFLGQYIAPEGYGGYLQLPGFFASGDDDSESGVGNIELGGLYRLAQGPESVLLLRGGLALETAGDEDSFAVPIATIAPRLTDAFATGFGTTWVRGEGSARYAPGTLRLGVSVGADIPLGDGDEGISLDLDAVARVAVSLGVETPGAQFSVGLSIFHALGSDGDSDDNTISALNAVAAFPVSPSVALYGAFGLPDVEDNSFDVWALGVGLRAAVR